MSETPKQRYNRVHRERLNAEARAYYHANKERCRQRQNEWRAENAEHVRSQALGYYRENRDINLVRMSRYKKGHRANLNAYVHQKLLTDKSFAATKRMRAILYKTIRGGCSDALSERSFGCGVLDLFDHIASGFSPGMSWDNYGEWEIDHRIPCRAFDCSDRLQREACWHYSNMQPLWASENKVKNKAIPAGFDPQEYTKNFHAA